MDATRERLDTANRTVRAEVSAALRLLASPPTLPAAARRRDIAEAERRLRDAAAYQREAELLARAAGGRGEADVRDGELLLRLATRRLKAAQKAKAR